MWKIELGRSDILKEVICLSQHLCYPREVHLDAIYRIFRYLQKNLGKNPGRMAYDPMYEPTDENVFEAVGRDLYECKYLYTDAQEIMPRHMPDALGKSFVIKAYMDANHVETWQIGGRILASSSMSKMPLLSCTLN